MNVADQHYCVGRGVAAIRGRNPTDTVFIRLAITASLQNLLSLTTGTVFPNISGSDLRQFEIPWPSAAERERIVTVIDSLDDLIAKSLELKDTLGRMIIAACHAAMEGREGDEVITLPTAIRLVNGGAFTKGADGSGRMVIRIKELTSGPSGTTVYNSISVPSDKSALPGDVLFAWSGSLGVWRWYGDDAIVNQHIFKVLPKEHPVWLGWVHILDSLSNFQDIAAGKATTMGHITKDHLDRTLVPKLTEGELSALAARVEPIWDLQLRFGREAAGLLEMRDFLLPRLLSGELHVPGVEDQLEVAS
jgi:type I restriction enzyme S subunit